MSTFNFNPLAISVSTSSALPVGTFLAKGSKAEIRKTANNIDALVIEIEIIKGDHTGAKGILFLNLWHTNPKVVEIASARLARYCYVNMLYQELTSVDQLLTGTPFQVEVEEVTKKDSNGNDYQTTEIKKFKYCDGKDIANGQQYVPDEIIDPEQSFEAVLINEVHSIDEPMKENLATEKHIASDVELDAEEEDEEIPSLASCADDSKPSWMDD